MRFALLIFATLFCAIIANAQPAATPSPVAPKATPHAKTEAAKTDAAKKTEKKEAAKPAAKETAKKVSETKLPTNPKDLLIEDLQVGGGKMAAKGKTIKVHYTGWLYDSNAPNGLGKQIDSSLKRGEPWSFVLGSGQVIKGWDEGFRDMKVGGKRRLIIPSEMGYGKAGARTEVPPNAPLLFEVELVDVLDTN